MPKTCSLPSCTRNCYGEYCLMHKPRKPLAVKTALPSPTKPIKRSAIRKVKTRLAMEWDFTRRTWLEEHASPYSCHYCGTILYKKTLTLDHKIPRSRAPHLRNDIANLVPCCFTCNSLKGSIDHDAYPHQCY